MLTEFIYKPFARKVSLSTSTVEVSRIMKNKKYKGKMIQAAQFIQHRETPQIIIVKVKQD